MTTLYTSFIDAGSAEKAAGALLDQGAKADDISIVASRDKSWSPGDNTDKDAARAEDSAKGGLSTTTGADAGIGMAKGATIGVGVAALAVLASIFVPGIGLVVGGGALATALAGGAATVVAGGVAGGVMGYLRDQGIPEEQATLYNAHFLQGGAILAVTVPTGDLTSGMVENILAKYGAMNVATYNSNHTVGDGLNPPSVPYDFDHAVVDPIPANTDIATGPSVKRITEASTGETRVITDAPVDTMTDPLTGEVIPVPQRGDVLDDDIVKRNQQNDAKLY